MAIGLAALLDDVAALAKAAAASIDDVGAAAARASTKAAGVVIDDAAVTPRYVRGLDAARELPIIKRIAIGSIRNKLLIILPAIMLMSQFLPWLLTPLLMIGGCYLAFEGAEKVYEQVTGNHHEESNEGKSEEEIVGGAVRTDFILSCEIMVISMNSIAAEGFWSRLITLVVVALAMTALVYGAVALIVRMDDIGLSMARRGSEGARRFGRSLVNAMPKVMTTLSFVGMIAMLWVGGHILLVGLDDLGLHWPYEFVHHLEEKVHGVPMLGWLVNTFFSAVLGLIVGGVVVAVVMLIRRTRGDDHRSESAQAPQAH